MIEDGQQVHGIDVQFERITGIVFDAHGEPADGAIVSAAPVSESRVGALIAVFPLTAGTRAVTDDRGVYRICEPPGVYRVSATLGSGTPLYLNMRFATARPPRGGPVRVGGTARR